MRGSHDSDAARLEQIQQSLSIPLLVAAESLAPVRVEVFGPYDYESKTVPGDLLFAPSAVEATLLGAFDAANCVPPVEPRRLDP